MKPLSFYNNFSVDQKVEVLFKRYYKPLCNGVYRILRDKDQAEDVVQEVFLKIWERKENLDMSEQFVFYLKRACYNSALNALKLQQNTDADIDTLETPSIDRSDDVLIKEELDKKIQVAIDDLPDKTRLVFMMSRYEELSYKEIAQQLDVSIKAVEKHMGIALKRLRVALKEHIYIFMIFLIENI